MCSLALLLVPSGHSICTIFILVQFSIFGQLLTVLLILSLDNELWTRFETSCNKSTSEILKCIGWWSPPTQNSDSYNLPEGWIYKIQCNGSFNSYWNYYFPFSDLCLHESCLLVWPSRNSLLCSLHVVLGWAKIPPNYFPQRWRSWSTGSVRTQVLLTNGTAWGSRRRMRSRGLNLQPMLLTLRRIQ